MILCILYTNKITILTNIKYQIKLLLLTECQNANVQELTHIHVPKKSLKELSMNAVFMFEIDYHIILIINYKNKI